MHAWSSQVFAWTVYQDHQSNIFQLRYRKTKFHEKNRPLQGIARHLSAFKVRHRIHSFVHAAPNISWGTGLKGGLEKKNEYNSGLPILAGTTMRQQEMLSFHFYRSKMVQCKLHGPHTLAAAWGPLHPIHTLVGSCAGWGDATRDESHGFQLSTDGQVKIECKSKKVMSILSVNFMFASSISMV